MFNKRTLQVQMVKTPRDTTTTLPTERKSLDVDAIVKIVERQTKRLALGGVAVYAAVVALNTASEIAINASPKR